MIPGLERSAGEGVGYPLQYSWTSLVTQTVILSAIWEAWLQSLDWEDPLEEEVATHFSILAWDISWTEKPGGLLSTESQRTGHNCTRPHAHW